MACKDNNVLYSICKYLCFIFSKEFKIKRIYRKVVLIQFNTSIHNDPSGQEPSTVDIKSLFVDNIRSTSK